MKLFDYECVTSFWSDFSIADRFGASAVKDTFKRAFNEWKEDIVYMTELTMVTNHKLWQHYEQGNSTLAEVYNELWQKADAWCTSQFTGSDLEYFYRITD